MSEAMPRHHGSPAAFRRALTDRLKAWRARAVGRLPSSSVISPTTGSWSACTSSTTGGS